MNTRNDNKYKMYLAVKKVIDEKIALWQTFPAFVSDFNRWKARLTTIDLLIKQAESSTGIAEDKTAARKAMADAAFEIGSAVHVYAVNAGNHELAEKVNFTVTDLTSGKDTVSSQRCSVIHTNATANLANLADYNITQAKLDALDTLIKAYDGMRSAPRTARVKNKTITTQLKTEVDKADEILKENLDRLMVQFKTIDSTFYSDYANARIIVDAGGGHSSADANKPTPPPAP